MKNALLKFAGLFVERVPVDEHGKPVQAGRGRSASPRAPQGPQGPPPPGHGAAPGQQPQHQQPGMAPVPVAAPGSGAMGQQPLQGQFDPAAFGAAGQPGAPAASGAQPVAIAMRAWIPREYAAHLAPHGLHVVAAGGSVVGEQAHQWGASAMVVSAECIAGEHELLREPRIATVLVTPQEVTLPDVPGLVQVQEPLRASELAAAVREAIAAWAAAHGGHGAGAPGHGQHGAGPGPGGPAVS